VSPVVTGTSAHISPEPMHEPSLRQAIPRTGYRPSDERTAWRHRGVSRLRPAAVPD